MSCGDPHEVDCREVLSEVYFYLDAECADARRDIIKRHLAECSPCLAEYGIEQDVRALVHRCCSQEVAPAEVKERLRAKLSLLDVPTDISGRRLLIGGQTHNVLIHRHT